MKVTKIPATLACLAVLFLCGGCSHVRPDFVPVREAIFRTEHSTTNRLSLPLSTTNREFLLAFLKSGRNPAMEQDSTIADPQAPDRYAGLIELLSRPDNLGVTNLIADEKFTPNPEFRRWFPKQAVRQIVDAHEDWPQQRQPYAFLDAWERNWWVFYHERKQLTHVMVTRALESKKPR
jgi:hypothetical protein